MRKIIFIGFIILTPVLLYFLFKDNYRSTKLQLETEKNESLSKNLEVYKSPISIDYLRNYSIPKAKIIVERELQDGFNYKKYIVSYFSEGSKVYALLTVPKKTKPQNGFPVVIFNHGYIPPKSYSTVSSYSSYVDYLARNDFAVLKIDMRGHGNSEGLASGSYFSNTYTIDLLSAINAIKDFSDLDSTKIGLWGHSMSGNLVLRTLLVTKEVKAAVIWAGAVYSYEDFSKYRISDSSYTPQRTSPADSLIQVKNRETSPEVSKIRSNPKEIDFSSDFWNSISLTKNINYLETPIQIHHAKNDIVVNIGYSRDLVEILKNNNKDYEYYEYDYGGHNIQNPSFNSAMSKTVEFFSKNLKN